MIRILPYPVGDFEKEVSPASGEGWESFLPKPSLPAHLEACIKDGSHPTDKKSRDNGRNVFAVVCALIEGGSTSSDIVTILRNGDYAISEISRWQTDAWIRALVAKAESRFRSMRRPLDMKKVSARVRVPLPTRENFWSLLHRELRIERFRWDGCLAEIIIDGGPEVLKQARKIDFTLCRLLQEGATSIKFDPKDIKIWLSDIWFEQTFDSQYEEFIRAVVRGREKRGAVLNGDEPVKFLEKAIPTYFNLPESRIHRLASRVLFRDLIALSFAPVVFDREVTVQQVVVLTGPEQTGKSTLCRILADGHMASKRGVGQKSRFLENLSLKQENDHKHFLKVSGKAVVEAREARGFSEESAERLKAEVERSVFVYDPKFIERSVEQRRRYLLITTTNVMRMLHPGMDIRRWVIVNTETKEFRNYLAARDRGDITAEYPQPNTGWLVEHRDILLSIAHDYVDWQHEMRLDNDDLHALRDAYGTYVVQGGWLPILVRDLYPVISAKGNITAYDVARWREYRQKNGSGAMAYEAINKALRDQLHFSTPLNPAGEPRNIRTEDTRYDYPTHLWISPGGTSDGPLYEWTEISTSGIWGFTKLTPGVPPRKQPDGNSDQPQTGVAEGEPTRH